MIRQPGGTWSADLYTVSESGTRLNAELDPVNGILTIIYTQSEGYNNIVYKQSNTGTINFGTQQILRSGSFNDISSTKQNYSNELVVIFHSSTQVEGVLCTPTVTTGADLAITKSDGIATIHPGDPLTYTIQVTNNGPQAATGATVTDTLPAALKSVSWTCAGANGGTCGTASGTGNINHLVNLPVSASATFTVSATLDLAATGTLTNTASVTPPGGLTDPLPGNNSATDTDTIITGGSSCGSDLTLVGCWLFSDGSGTTTADGSGNGNTGTLVGATWVADRFGNPAKALHFDGTSQYVKVPDSNSLDITGDITISAWAKPEQVATQDLVKKAVTTGTYVPGYELDLSSSSGNCAVTSGGTNPCAFARFNATSSAAPDTYRIDTKTTYSATDPWTLYTATLTKADNTLRIYKNGTLSNSYTPGTTLTIPANSLFLGFGAQLEGAGPTATRFFMGSLDDIRIYSRALSLAEIQALAGETPPTCNALTLSHNGQGSNPVASPANSTGCATGLYQEGESISLSGAVPSAGWHISGWTGTNNDASTASTNSLSMPAGAKTVSVNYVSDVVTSCGSDPSLVGCWQMEEGSGSVLLDGSSFTNDASVIGSPAWVAGKVGTYALDLNGTSQYATVPDNASLDITNQITIAAWIKPSVNGTQYLVKKGNRSVTPASGYELSLATSSGSTGAFFFRINDSSTCRVDSTILYSNYFGTWVHVAATYDHANLHIYVNGVQVDDAATSCTVNIVTDTSKVLAIGAQSDGGSKFTGSMDDVRVYNRALSAAEILQLATGTSGTHSISLVAGWNLVSFNLHPTSTAVADVLASISGQYTLVYAWDPTNGWKLYDPTLGELNDLKTLDQGMGFWIKMNTARTLIVSGTAVNPSNIALKTGWNLVGYPSSGTLTLPNALSLHGVGTDFSLVYAYHAIDTGDEWKLFDRSIDPLLNNLTEMAPGWGYWVNVSADHTWHVEY